MDLLNYMSDIQCCSNVNTCSDSEIGDYCGHCYSVFDGVRFETPFTSERGNPKTRQIKFFNTIQEGAPDLPWSIRQSLLDLFPCIERHFYRSSRINFIHMGQLVIEMLKVLDAGEYAENFNGLKTVSRVKLVKKFVNDALKFDSTRCKNLVKIEDLDYIVPKLDYEVDMSKVPDCVNHIFSDRFKVLKEK